MGLSKAASERRRQIVGDMLRKHPDWRNLTLAKALFGKHPKLFPSLHSARGAVGHARGNWGKLHRKKATDKSNFRPNGKQSDRSPLPKSRAVPWTPFVIDAKRVLVFGDVHIPYHDDRAVETMLRYGKSFKPDAILINGDLLDFESLSKYDKPPGPTAKDELTLGREFFKHLNEQFPKARKFLKCGNHEERWGHYFQRKALELEELCRDVWQHYLGTADYGVEVIDLKRIVMCGRLPILHGHEFKGGATSPVNPARGAALKAKHTVMINHHHQTSTQPITNVFHDEAFAWSLGCLCDLNPFYMPINEWNHGFATIEIADDGDFNVENLRIKDGKVRKS